MALRTTGKVFEGESPNRVYRAPCFGIKAGIASG
jgi:hypothetical protein